MTNLGDTRLDARNRMRTWKKCIDCGLEFWSLGYDQCLVCFNQVGNEFLDYRGKIWVKLPEDSPFYDMTIKYRIFGAGWTTKARYIMAQHLGRCLEPWEAILHIDKDKNNFDIDNLKLQTKKPRQSLDQEPLGTEEEPEHKKECTYCNTKTIAITTMTKHKDKLLICRNCLPKVKFMLERIGYEEQFYEQTILEQKAGRVGIQP